MSAIGVQLGGLTPLIPERRKDLAEVSIRALTAGCIACFMTACIAGTARYTRGSQKMFAKGGVVKNLVGLGINFNLGSTRIKKINIKYLRTI